MRDTPAPVFIFSTPRTRSNLLARLLETHPRTGNSILYPLRAAYCAGIERPIPDSSVFATRKINEEETFQFAYDKLKQRLTEDQDEGLVPLVKDHILMATLPSVINSYCNRSLKEGLGCIIDPDGDNGFQFNDSTPEEVTNSTCLPEVFLYRIIPVITIRDPIRATASAMGIMLRSLGATLDEANLEASCTFKWSRLLFDYYGAKGGPAPIVVDGDKLVKDPQGQMKKLCELIDIDESGIQYTWEARIQVQNEEMHEDVFMGVLHRSTGVIRGNDAPLDLEEEVKNWEDEWGTEVAETMRGYVERSMEDYQYLRQHAI
ncbi:hypothetical protein Moror_2613 [Moniliophthora roreri MCA 2997]|uniref:P-loop containing nucleoside triphosphate hydrolase protein n=1 Tax=Moniliophthora roreri (strain MCA 2997) TaxID=1381753 RepID=V2XF59_MONRO|nr:hypothetical protein Moror_2613 [Moniliophthora roreri MCA 2997]